MTESDRKQKIMMLRYCIQRLNSENQRNIEHIEELQAEIERLSPYVGDKTNE